MASLPVLGAASVAAENVNDGWAAAIMEGAVAGNVAEGLSAVDVSEGMPGVELETIDLLTAPDVGTGGFGGAGIGSGGLGNAELDLETELADMLDASAGAEAPPPAAYDDPTEAARVQKVCEAMTMPRARPEIAVQTSPPAHPPVLRGGEGQPFVQVPADGLCFYHCGVACRDLREWWLTHSASSGLAHNDDARKLDVAKAHELRDAILAVAAEVFGSQVRCSITDLRFFWSRHCFCLRNCLLLFFVVYSTGGSGIVMLPWSCAPRRRATRRRWIA